MVIIILIRGPHGNLYVIFLTDEIIVNEVQPAYKRDIGRKMWLPITCAITMTINRKIFGKIKTGDIAVYQYTKMRRKDVVIRRVTWEEFGQIYDLAKKVFQTAKV